jgi:hypothetical protein
MTITILQRVVGSLQAHGNGAEADELIRVTSALREQVGVLLGLIDQSQHTVREYIYTVQSRCPHHEWTATGSCYLCGLRVDHPAMDAFVTKITKGEYYAFKRAGGRLTLPVSVRAAIKDELHKTKQELIDANQKRLRDPRGCTGGSEAAVNDPGSQPTVHDGQG